MSPNFTVTYSIATPEDIQACHEVDKSRKEDTGTQPKTFEDAAEGERLLVAKSEDKVVGYLRWGFIWDDELPYVQIIQINDDFQGKGIGIGLMDSFESQAQKLGYPRIISSTDDQNLAAKKFHEAYGFSQIGSLRLDPADHLEIFYAKEL